MELLERSVRWLVENRLLGLFVAFQIGLLVFALWKLSTEENAWHTRTSAWASFLTVFGIFGTFLGISFGLQGFNVEDIEGSIGPLLEGLKLAFFTSLVGIGSALGLRLVALYKTRSQDNLAIKAFADALTETLKTVETSGEINLSSQLKELTTTVGSEGRKTRESLGGIKTNLIGIQTAFTDGQNATFTQLHDLTEVVTKNHTELTTMQSEEGSQTRRALKEMEASLAAGQNANLTQLRSLTTTFIEKHAQLTQLQIDEGDKTRQALEEMKTAIVAGQSEGFSQLRSLTTTFAEKHDLLVGEFRAFSQNLADSIAKLATEELIGALETVIKDFNTNITEQFGDNFKQLNEAVGRTLAWQEQYRQQMSKLISQMSELISGLGDAAEIFERARDSLEDIAKSSRLISERSESIVACAEKLDPVLHTLNDQLEAFSELRERAQEAFPIIEDRLTELTIGFSDAVTKTITASHASMAEQRAALTAQSEQIQTTLDGATQEFTELTNNFSVSVQTALDRAQTSTAEQKAALQQLQNIIKATLEGFSKVVDDTVTQSQLSMRQQREELATLTRQLQENFRLLESTLEAELTSCLKVLAGQLAGISDKFVKDYTPLTEELHRIVNVARNVPPVNNRRL